MTPPLQKEATEEEIHSAEHADFGTLVSLSSIQLLVFDLY